MNKTKSMWVLTLLVVVAVMVGGWFVLIDPARGKAAEIETQAQAQETANRATRNQIAMLKEQAKRLPAEQAKLNEIAKKIPADPALPAFIRALTDAAETSNIEILSLKPEKPQLLSAPLATTPTGTTPTGTTPTGTTPTGTTPTGTTPGTATGTQPAGATGTPTVVPPQLAFIKLELTVQGSYSDLQELLASIEKLSRAVLVSDVNVVVAKQKGPSGARTSTGSDAMLKNGSVLEMKLGGRLFMTVPNPTTGTGQRPAASTTAPRG